MFEQVSILNYLYLNSGDLFYFSNMPQYRYYNRFLYKKTYVFIYLDGFYLHGNTFKD